MNNQRTYRRNIFTQWEVGWELLLALVTLYAVYRIPLDIVMGSGTGFNSWVLDLLATVVFVVDPLQTYRVHSRRQSHHGSAFLRTMLPLDVITAAAILIPGETVGWHLLALLKVIHVTSFISVWRHQLIKRGSVVRLFLFVYWLILLIHLTACGWIYIRVEPLYQSANDIYVTAVYWSVTTLTTIGYGDITPNSISEMKYAIGIMIVGFLMMGYLIGNIASILNNPDPLRAQYAEALEEVSAFIQYNGLPADLNYRIVDYFSYMWQQKAGFSENKILGMLPGGIRTEISLHLKRDVIQRVPFFRNADETFIREIAHEMRPLVVTPGEHVFHSGDTATNMYFISRGNLEVLDDAGNVIGELDDGDFFGEMALLENRRRMGSVKAIDYCELYELSAESFHRIVDAHPDFAAYMQRIATERSNSIKN